MSGIHSCPVCGGKLRGHGPTSISVKAVAQRMRCKDCGKTVTVRDGKFSSWPGSRFAVQLEKRQESIRPPIHPFVLGLAA